MLASRYTRNALQRLYFSSARAAASSWAAVSNPDALRQAAGQARQQVLDDLADHLTRLEASAQAAGIRVHWADDYQEANRLVVASLRAAGAGTALRNHSPLLDEIAVDRAAAANQITLQRLHPGDAFVALESEQPSHPVYPAAHLRTEDISTAMNREWRVPITLDPELLARTTMLRLRPALRAGSAAVLGLNFAVAETGALVCLDNDGHNASLAAVTSHLICLVGINQVVADTAGLHLLVQAFSRSAWGRPLPAYLTALPGPDDSRHPRTVDLILVDNGRSRLLNSEFAAALRCIDCGACHSVCPVFLQVGARGYANSPFAGPIGAILNPVLLRPGLASGQAGLSTGCRACGPVCPVGIDLPGLLHQQRVTQAHDASWREEVVVWLWQRLLSHPWLFHRFLRLAYRLRMR